MSIDPTIAVLYAQTGYTARAVHEAATAPQTAVAMARVMAAELVKQEQKQVQGAQKGGETRVADGGEDRRQDSFPFGSRRRNRTAQPPPDAEEAPSGGETPLVGNLLNLKV